MNQNVLLAMPMFNNDDNYNLDTLLIDLGQRWGFEISESGGDDDAAVISIDGNEVAIAFMSVPVPWGDIEGTAKYAYNWPRALNELADHTGHAIVSILSGNPSPKQRFLVLSKVLYSMLATSNSVGVYQGSQSLLIPRHQYLGIIDKLESDDIPLQLWIYIGLKEYKTSNCAYTYGLTAFGKKEFEVINSNLSLEELYSLLFTFGSYVIIKDITLKAGETLGYTVNQKIHIEFSEGAFVEGESIKLLT